MGVLCACYAVLGADLKQDIESWQHKARVFQSMLRLSCTGKRNKQHVVCWYSCVTHSTAQNSGAFRKLWSESSNLAVGAYCSIVFVSLSLSVNSLADKDNVFTVFKTK